ncbi:RrF2 family transcriptional regulator [Flavihumibacter sp.]|uniref:RrF2 family transcriptional regulator n=1 Tax=Flavihumibacter sp. TaxID=1913981 RepID=UPI002FCC13A0|nr:Rrf2 family transcriptional regulator [Flavihumibacter sediminis]
MFSKTTEYALRATIYIAQKSTVDKKLGIAEIAKAIDSPQSFTAKIIQQLTRGNTLVSSVRGPNGGFYMTEKAKRLPVRVILDLMGEDSKFQTCILGLKQCSEIKPCPMHFEYKPIKEQLISLFADRSIESLAEDINNEHAFINSRNKRG